MNEKIKWQTFEVASSLAQRLRKERWREIEASLGVEQVRKVTSVKVTSVKVTRVKVTRVKVTRVKVTRVKLFKLTIIFDSLE